MPRACTICTHPERPAIDRALAEQATLRVIARRFAVSEDALQRHKSEHIPAALSLAKEAESVAADDLLAQVIMLQAKTLRILETAEASGTMNVALGAVREARGNIELLAKLTHQLNDRPVLNILIAPEWLQVRAALLEALGPYPDARVAVAGRLDALGDGT